MQNLEKRTSPRQSLQIPLRFRNVDVGSDEPELASETINVSRSGLFMRSPLPLRVGAPLFMTLRVPTYLSGSARAVIQCVGRVVHERNLPNGDIGYGIQFEQMLTLQQASVARPANAHAHATAHSST